VFERVELEGGVEEDVRRAFDDRGALSMVKAVPSTLRAAFALAVVAEISSRTHIPVSALEVWQELTDIGQDGWPRAEDIVARLGRERETEATRARQRLCVRTALDSAVEPAPLPEEPSARASAVLAASGATLLDCRGLAGGLLEVTYRFMGERLRAIVQGGSLQVVDAGICLAGHDREVTLDSLPSVVREGVRTGQLVITRHV
jgi:hypothetical protein